MNVKIKAKSIKQWEDLFYCVGLKHGLQKGPGREIECDRNEMVGGGPVG